MNDRYPTTTEILVDGRPVQGTVTTTQDWIDVTPLTEPDPHWEWIDSHDHQHKWMAGPDPVVPLHDPSTQQGVLPTLVAVDDLNPHWCSDCDGEYQPWHYECRVCGDLVRPGMRPPVGRYRIPGLRHMEVEVAEFLPLGLVEVTLLTDPPQVMSGRVVSAQRSRAVEGGVSGSSRIVPTSVPQAVVT